ncbi:uncharacterized protein SOCE26_032440 [Sorangium cellulosum]|uniref:Uncharacterized protein n=1 Tax=Sorangium cellulosum TaxID=56 RepID=A0A2L0ER98_SORCE|nr:uncharacterized protein SOCE26_032440 [Sorangium cellulosum]
MSTNEVRQEANGDHNSLVFGRELPARVLEHAT